MKKTANRVAALCLCLLALALILTISGLSANHADHHCSGEDCAVCAVIRDLDAAVRSMGTGSTMFAAAAAAIFLTCSAPRRRIAKFRADTPVTLKERLLI